MRVLDVGCGTGDVLFLATRLVGPTGAVLGVDRSAAAVAVAERRARDAGLGNVSFVVQELSEVTVTAPVDALVGRLVLMYLDDPAAALGRTGLKLARIFRGAGLPAPQTSRAPGWRAGPGRQDDPGGRRDQPASARHRPPRAGRRPHRRPLHPAGGDRGGLAELAEAGPVGLLGPATTPPGGSSGPGPSPRPRDRPAYHCVQQEQATCLPAPTRPRRRPTTTPTNHARGARLAVLGEVAAELGATPNQVVLAWLMGGQRPIIPVVGTSTVAQLDELLGVVELPWTTTSAGTWTWPAVTPTTNRPSSAGCAPPSGRPSGTRPARSTSYDLHALHTSAYCRGHGPRPGTGCSRSHAQCTQGAGRRAWPYPDRLPTRRVGEARCSPHQRRDRRAIGPS